MVTKIGIAKVKILTSDRHIHAQKCFEDPIPSRWQPPGGVLKFGFGRDVPPRNWKVEPYIYQFFQKSDPCTNRTNFALNFE